MCMPSGPRVLALQQQSSPRLTCTHAAGGTIFCAIKVPVSPPADSGPAAISVQCVSPAGLMVEVTAEGQVRSATQEGNPLPVKWLTLLTLCFSGSWQ